MPKIHYIDSSHFLFGGKGDVWTNNAHIAKSGFHSTTLCGRAMLSTNWVAFEGIENPGCQECIKIYNENKDSRLPLVK